MADGHTADALVHALSIRLVRVSATVRMHSAEAVVLKVSAGKAELEISIVDIGSRLWNVGEIKPTGPTLNRPTFDNMRAALVGATVGNLDVLDRYMRRESKTHLN